MFTKGLRKNGKLFLRKPSDLPLRVVAEGEQYSEEEGRERFKEEIWLLYRSGPR